MRQWAFALIGAGAIGCGGPSGPSASTTAVVKGIVGYFDPAYAPFPGATVTVETATRGDGQVAGTDSAGAYTLQAPVGAFRLRYSAQGYVTTESQYTVATGDQTTMPEVLLKTGPWALAGIVSDSRGTPVSGVSIGVVPITVPVANVTTDVGGHYRYPALGSSVGQHGTTMAFWVGGIGVWPAYLFPACCNSPGDTIYNFKVRHVLAFTVTAPSTTLHVGDRTVFTLNTT